MLVLLLHTWYKRKGWVLLLMLLIVNTKWCNFKQIFHIIMQVPEGPLMFYVTQIRLGSERVESSVDVVA